MSKPKSILIDGMNLCYRHFFSRLNEPLAYRRDTSKAKIYVGMYQGFFATIAYMKNKFPTHQIYVLWDSKTRFRYTIDPEYKKRKYANDEVKEEREQQREMLNSLLPELYRMIKADEIHQIRAPDYEADDVAAMLVKKLIVDSVDIILWSGDLDWAQLIQPKVRWFNPSKSNKMYDTSQFKSDYGFPPEGLLLYKCLTGDPSDNIKGVFKFPKKLAKVLASKAVNVESFYYDKSILNDVPQKWKDEIKEATAQLRKNHRLIMLYANIETVEFIAGEKDIVTNNLLFRKYGLVTMTTRNKVDAMFLKKRNML